jgi:hypothetical protein
MDSIITTLSCPASEVAVVWDVTLSKLLIEFTNFPEEHAASILRGESLLK